LAKLNWRPSAFHFYPAELSFYDRLGILGQDYALGLVPPALGYDPGIADTCGPLP
jgi:hypothetical protein